MSFAIVVANRTESRTDVVVIEHGIAMVDGLYDHGFVPPVLLLDRPKHNLVRFLTALLVVSVRSR